MLALGCLVFERGVRWRLWLLLLLSDLRSVGLFALEDVLMDRDLRHQGHIEGVASQAYLTRGHAMVSEVATE